jgi:phage-related protein (TIGR01555 family)
VTENTYVRIHHSRLIRFDGERLPDRLYVRNGYWHDSIFTKLYDSIRNYTTAQGSLASVIQETNQAVYKIEGLHEAVSQDEDELIIKRMEIINNLRSSMRAIVLDKEDEFMFMQTALTGVSDLMGDLSARLVAASDIPHTRLLGESPGASLGQNGRSELIDYYDMVASHQKIHIKGPINRLKDLIFAQKSSPYKAPEGLVFSFNPLFQQDQEAMIRTRQIQATIDKMYMDQGVYYPDEVAFNRFASGEYSFETALDDRARGIVEKVSTEQPSGEEDPTNVAVKTAETLNQEG